MVLSRADLIGASRLSLLLMLALALVVLGSVGAASYIVGRSLSSPIRRLRAALRDAASGDLAFRLSHDRKDEFGELFDAYNAMAANLEDQVATARLALEGGPQPLAATPPPAPLEGPFAPPPAADAFAESPPPQPSDVEATGPRKRRSPRKAPPSPPPPAPVDAAAEDDPILPVRPASVPAADVDDQDRTVIRPKHVAEG